MIRYTVVWHDEAQNQLAEIWINASDREAVRLSVNAIDRHLANDAESKGTKIEGDLRQLVVPPLRLLFSVSEPDRLARILDVAVS